MDARQGHSDLLLLLGLITNKKNRENRSLVIPCFIIQGLRLLWARWFFTVTSVVDPRVRMVIAFSPNEVTYLLGTITTFLELRLDVSGCSNPSFWLGCLVVVTYFPHVRQSLVL